MLCVGVFMVLNANAESRNRQQKGKFGHRHLAPVDLRYGLDIDFKEQQMNDIIYTTATTKIALVTGGSRGLGRSTVLSLAKRRIASIFTYNANKAEADKVVDAAAGAGSKAIALQLDTGVSAQFDDFIDRVRAALAELGSDRIDFLVNNAGTSHHNSIEKTTEAELDALYNVHFKGVFFLTQKLLPLLRDGGRIVNVSTGLTRVTVPESGPYASMKGAVEVLTRYLAKELGNRRIAVNTVAPGAIQTDFSGGIVRDNPDVNKFVAGVTALGRPGVPEDIGPLIASLLAEDNRWINAQRIEASGGMSI
jgi:NAD(P)-dependent dehydrogenase (short-subunit alcohol dehydrogenase family)